MKKQKQSNLSFQNATGVVRYKLTNDYMFRFVLQKNKKVLTALICALLHLDKKDIKSIRVTNPIEYGKSCDEKEFRLDINILLNDDTKINLEMQVENERNWPDRSLSYLCRSFDALERGQDYTDALPVIHIGFLDYTLFEDAPEFYATYKMMNVKSHYVYSDKLQIGVVNLSQIELATEEDRRYGIDRWARLFKAGTWEELKAMAAKNQIFAEAAQTMYEMTADENVRELCRRREDYYRQMRTYERDLADKDAEIERITRDKDAEIQRLLAEITRLREDQKG